MQHVDLDAARSARAEVQGVPPTVTFGGQEYELVQELPLTFYEFLAKERPRLAVAVLLAKPEDLEGFMRNNPTREDLWELASLYGFKSLGESSASGRSSNGSGSPSRPTSKHSTDSTSENSVGAAPE